MHYILRKFYLILCLLFAAGASQATHIVGGEIYYKHLGSNYYKVYFDFYIDCQYGIAAAINADINGSNFAVFDGATNDRLSQYDQNGIKPLGKPIRVSATNYTCILTKPNACVDKYQFEFTVYLPPSKGGYIIAYQRCCRNNTITNLVEPGATGSTYWTKIEDFTGNNGNNNSAVFKNLPPNFLCTNAPLSFDHSANDPDNDSLVYELFHPYNSFRGNVGANQSQPKPDASEFMSPPFTTVTWLTGYSATNQIDAISTMTIDSRTGLLSFIPNKTGQFVVGILVKEYRNGLLIGVTRRDFQFNVSNCTFEVVSAFSSPTKSCDYSVHFNNSSVGTTPLTYFWDFGDPTSTADVSTEVTPSYTYPKGGGYNIRLVAKGAICSDTYYRTVNVIDSIQMNLGPNDTTCSPFKKILKAAQNTGTAFFWSTGEQGESIIVSKSGTYTVRTKKEICEYTDTISIVVDDEIPKLPEDSIICNDEIINMTLDVGPTFIDYQWNTGVKNASINVTQIGNYAVAVITKYGCQYTASFNLDQQMPPAVNIKDTSICPFTSGNFTADNNNVSYLWNTGETSKQITVSNPGDYWIKVFDGKCYGADTASLKVFDLGKYGLPDDTAFCDKVYFGLKPGAQFTSYKWNTGEITQEIIALERGQFLVEMTSKEGCKVSDSINIVLNPLPNLGLGNDTTICEAIDLTLDAGVAVSYLWHDGSTERTIKTKEKGLYTVVVKDTNGCYNSDSIFIDKDPMALPSDLYMPTAFTPNGDGLNDIFPNNQYQDIGVEYNLKIFNRWGEKLEDFDSPSMNWDGRSRDLQVQEGVYVYMVTWLGCDNKRRTLKGNVTLLK